MQSSSATRGSTGSDAYDVIVVGAGHNGLVAAAYLAKAGLRTLVVERREVVGGAAVTEELIPGFRVSAASYSLSLFRPDIYRDLELARHGLEFYPKDPQLFVPLLDGRHFFIWRDGAATEEQIASIEPKDVEGYRRFGRFWDEAVELLRPAVESSDPPTLAELEADLARRGREDVFRLAVTGSAADNVEEFFVSKQIAGAFASQGIIGTARGPRSPGTAWVMAYHFIGGELNGATGTWAYVRGGMGALTKALAAAAIEAGAEIRTAQPVERIVVENGRVAGVAIEGRVVAAPRVLSSADPYTTFHTLIGDDDLTDPLREKLAEWRMDGSVVKVNLALAELPDFLCRPGTSAGAQHLGTVEISPSVDYLEDAYAEAAGGRFSTNPFMEVFIQSASDRSLVDGEGHVLSAFSQYAPSGLDAAGWENERERAYACVLNTLAAYAPNVPDAIIASDVLTPADLEQRFGLTGGNIFHGEITPEQCFAGRFPYRTGIVGLYLGGSGAPPGGGVMGAAGRNASAALVIDAQAR